jgi:hypothetical protein
MTTIGRDKKQFFFDRQIVIDAVGKATAGVLSKAGAFIQRAARSSLRRRKRSSEPGEPPSVHSTDNVASLKNIWFSFDPANRSVVIGPLKLNQVAEKYQAVRMVGRTTIPELHEFGGVASIREIQYAGSNLWFRQDLRHRRDSDKKYRRRNAVYRKRPFMGPAMKRELPKFEGLWANSVK